jgi:hypothetical protein
MYDSMITSTDDGNAKVYKLRSDPYHTELQVLDKDGTYIYYQTRLIPNQDGSATNVYLADAETTDAVEVRMEFSNFQIFTGPDKVPSVYLSEEEKASCLLMDPSHPSHSTQCQGAQSEDLTERTKELFNATIGEKSLGFVPTTSSGYPDASIPYVILGSDAEIDGVMNLKSFVPGMVGCPQLRVRSQGYCGSCYSIGTSHSITSSYLHQHPDEDPGLLFSNQQAMNCLPLKKLDMFDQQYKDEGTGYWGAEVRHVYDWLVHTGSRMPKLETVPYIGFQGGCDYSVDSIDTGEFTFFI